MQKYKIVTPENYNKEHIDYLEELKKSTIMLSLHSNIRMLVKDINSKLIIGSDTSAKALGLKHGLDLQNMLMSDVPFKPVAECAEQFKLQEQNLLQNGNIHTRMDVLDIFERKDGIKPSVTSKKIIFHKESYSILGFINTAIHVKLNDFVNIIPTYNLRFGAIKSIESLSSSAKIFGDNIILSSYEQEICFLLLLGWNYNDIALFMGKFRPDKELSSANSIIRQEKNIAKKLKLNDYCSNTLLEYLVSINFHRKIPESFYSRIIGSRVL